MRKNYFITLLLTLCFSAFSFGQDLVITGVYDGPNSGGTPKGMEIYVINDIADLSAYGVGSANNGGGSDGEEFTFPADAVTSGTYIYVASEEPQFTSFFGFAPTYNAGSAMGINGDDAVELFHNGTVIDTFGDINTDGNNEVWEYLDGWAYRIDGTGPEGTTFTPANWTYSGVDGLTGGTTNAATNSPFPIGTYSDSASSDPSMTISGVSNGQEFSPETTEVTVTFNIQNFTLSADNGSGGSDGSGDGYVLTTLQETGEPDDVVGFFTTTPPPISVEPGKTYTLTAELVDNSGNSLSPAVSVSNSFSVAAYTEATNIAALRAGSDGDYFELTGEAVLTFIGTSRNQKYIEDSSAAILIDDNNGTITTSYSIGDGITGIKGRLSSFSGVTQFVPSEDPGAASSTGNAITPQTVSIAQLLANLNDYESEWITINDVTFADADGSATFSTGSNYDITDGTDTMVFRVQFSSAASDLDGTVIPTSSANITGLAAEFNGTSQIMGTTLANIVLGIADDQIDGFAAYPNPVNGNQLTVTANSLDTKTVAIYNVLGKKVFTRTFSGAQDTFDVSNVASGIYILKVTEGNRISTQKLIIE